jgi:phosphohistidine phosphatase
MKTLLILRHAKSSWKCPELSDHDRPLNKRGKRDAPIIGGILRKKGLVPNLILSSTAVRAKDTASAVASASGYAGKIIFLHSLYSANPNEYIKSIEHIRDCDNYSSILIVGHNPEVEELIQILTGEFQEMPTCALAVITLQAETWLSLRKNVGQGKLIALWRPRELT